MLLDLVHIGGAEIRGYSGGSLIRALIAAAYLTVGIACIFYSYSHQAPHLREIGIAVLVLGGLVAWLGALKRYRAIVDTPTAVLRSAAQGYVELVGNCKIAPDQELLRYGKAPPCLWYLATIVEQRRSFGNSRTRTRYARSEYPFLIEDGTGECLIDPNHAEVQSAHQTSWREATTYFRVTYLLPGDRIYAIGDMRTLRAGDGTLDRKTDLNSLLREWKQDRAQLLKRFDTNGDGDIDMREWQRAVTTAERHVDAQHKELRRDPGIHIMRAPGDGRPFLLSNRDPDDLRQRYKWWGFLHLGVFIAATAWGMTLLLDPGA